jgi:hypothetical protein
MAKKMKRQVRRDADTPLKTQASAAAGVAPRQTEWNPDYSYVTRDLRRIGILAGSFITILVVLSFFLR